MNTIEIPVKFNYNYNDYELITNNHISKLYTEFNKIILYNVETLNNSKHLNSFITSLTNKQSIALFVNFLKYHNYLFDWKSQLDYYNVSSNNKHRIYIKVAVNKINTSLQYIYTNKYFIQFLKSINSKELKPTIDDMLCYSNKNNSSIIQNLKKEELELVNQFDYLLNNDEFITQHYIYVNKYELDGMNEEFISSHIDYDIYNQDIGIIDYFSYIVHNFMTTYKEESYQDKPFITSYEDFKQLKCYKLTAEDYIVIEKCHCKETRIKVAELYEKHYSKSKNFHILPKIISIRNKIAKFYGAKNYSDYMFRDSNFFKNTKECLNYLNLMGDDNKIKLEQYLMKLDEKAGERLKINDIFYYSDNHNTILIDDGFLTHGFNIDNNDVVFNSGEQTNKTILQKIVCYIISYLCKKLNYTFQIQFTEHISRVEIYDEITIVIKNKKQKNRRMIGIIYLDLFEREDNYNDICNMRLSGGYDINNSIHIIPSNIIILNYKVNSTITKIIEYDILAQIFHELGHSLHNIISGHQKYIIDSSYHINNDFLELPSVVFELFATDFEIINTICNYSGNMNETDIQNIITNIKSNMLLTEALNIIRSKFELKLYQYKYTLDKNVVLQLYNELMNKYFGDRYVYTYDCLVSHLSSIDYAATYYKYIYIESIAKKIYSKLITVDNYWETYKLILSYGSADKFYEYIKNETN